MDKSYIAINNDINISDTRNCKHVGYDYYCEDLYVVKHKSRYSYETATFFDLPCDLIMDNCQFTYYFNSNRLSLQYVMVEMK